MLDLVVTPQIFWGHDFVDAHPVVGLVAAQHKECDPIDELSPPWPGELGTIVWLLLQMVQDKRYYTELWQVMINDSQI